jgi:selenide,water dikinase
MAHVPLLDNVLALAQAGHVTGASARNWRSYGAEVHLDPQLDSVSQALLCDPQTSGGLLVACAEDTVAEAMAVFARHGFVNAASIGRMQAHAPRVVVDP